MNEVQSVLVSNHLQDGRIAFYSDPVTKLFVFNDLISRLQYHKPEALLEAIVEREKAGSTLLAPGISIPHARRIDIPDVMAAMGICLEGVEDPKGSEAVRIFLLFAGPANHMKRNLDFLAAVSHLFSVDGFTNKLLGACYPSTAMSLIRDAESQS